MHIAFEDLNTEHVQLKARTYDPDLHDIRDILSDACEAMETHAQFIISGFGQDRWAVDVGTDLVVFLDQLPRIIRKIDYGIEAEINLYEQGVERIVVLPPQR